MTSSKLTFLKAAHAILMIFAVVSVCRSTMFPDGGDLAWTYLLPSAALMAVSFVIYAFAGKLWVYLILQAALIAGTAAFGGVIRAECIVSLALALALQVVEKKREYFSMMEPAWGFCGLFAALYFLCLVTGTEKPKSMIAVILMMYIIIVMYYMNAIGLSGFLGVRKNAKNISGRQADRVNGIFMAGVTAALAMVFMLTGFFMDDSPLKALSEMFAELLRRIISFLNSLSLGWVVDDDTMSDLPVEELPDQFPQTGKVGQGFVIPDWVYYLVGGIIVAGLAFLIIRGIFKLVVILMRRFAQRNAVVFEDPETEDEVTDLGREEKAKRAGRPRNSSERIRRLYVKTVEKHRKRKHLGAPAPALAPEGIEYESFSGHEVTGADVLHSTYEKARYGRQGANDDDEKALISSMRG